MSTPTNRTYHVQDDHGSVSVKAAYYVHEDDFTVFKSEDGSVVASFHNGHLTSILAQP